MICLTFWKIIVLTLWAGCSRMSSLIEDRIVLGGGGIVKAFVGTDMSVVNLFGI